MGPRIWKKTISICHVTATGKMATGTAFQSYLDVLDILETTDLTEDEKHIEKEKVLEARKEAFGPEFKYYPPWRTRI